ncbi:RNA helicase [Chelatococcus daeguensis]|uniref:RNA helicase n=1 Tax=Chelatococcus daeguensis TaxID=444444 RepID=A0AAC9JQG4_9HYPH|nr:helicase-related protein [Chelatococcus daeguensis]APF36459.1 RNA helicase [Chelatococcus daeguensis]
MIRLEEIVPGARIRGIAGTQFVEVLAARSFGPDAVEVTYKLNGAVDQTVLFRSSESELELAELTRRFAFDGDGHLLRLASEALRIRLAHLFDPFLAVRSSQIEALPHQLTAVYEEMLPRQPLRFLLADDPGAGKTIMAGLLIKELLIRGDLERCLIVAPGSLVEQWQDELKDKFSIDFDILTRDQIEASSTGNFFAERQRVIARLDMLSRAQDLQDRLKAAPSWDLVICDEAHRMSASFFGGEVKYTKRYQLGQLLGAVARHFLLMTATPHNGKEEDFQLFMGLLDSDRFEGRFRQGVHKIDPSDMMRRLTKEELRRFDGSPLFPERKAYTVSYKLSDREAVLYEAVTRYVRDEMNRADQIEEGGDRRRNNVGFALQILQRRLASSPAAIHESLKRRLARLEARLEEERLLKRGQEAAGQLATRVDLPAWDEEDIEEAPEDELEDLEDQVVDQATAARTIAELEAEIASLRELEKLARELRRSGEDTKWRELDRILDDPIVHDPDNDVRRKIVIFTESRDTLEYLAGRIRGRTGEEESVVVIHGGVPRDRRRAAIAAFNDDPKVRFLIANDAAGEGVNLQRGAHLMVNYDLPWNPNRLEQRFGRIHRIGQTEVCHLWNLIAGETREGQVYARLLEKLEIAREALGGKVYDVLGELFEARALRDMFMEAIRYNQRPDVLERHFKTIDIAFERKRIEEVVARSKLTKEGLDPSTITALKEEMERAEARRLQPRYIRSFFEEAFALAGGVMHQRETGRYEVRRVPAILRDRDRLIGRGDPVLPRYERICFDKADVPGKRQAALVAPGHPLLDATVDLTLERYRNLLAQGAVLVDDNDTSDEPRVLVYLEHAIRDGRVGGNGRPRLISQRLQFVYLDRYGKATDGGAAPYLDCRPPTENEKRQVEEILKEGWLAGDIEDRVRGYAIAELVPRHLEEVKARRLDEIARTEAAVKERLRREILHWQSRALELEREEQAGKQQRLNSQNARRYVETLTDRLDKRLAELAKERQIAPLPPEIQGAALVIPIGWFAKKAQPVAALTGLAEGRAAVEKLAMDAVMVAERSLGREPRDVSAENRGYDIESRDPKTGSLTFIEVKGRVDGADTVAITRNEMLTAFNAEQSGLSYILAVVRVEVGFAQQPVYVRNPTGIFGAEPGFTEVSRILNLSKILAVGGPPA